MARRTQGLGTGRASRTRNPATRAERDHPRSLARNYRYPCLLVILVIAGTVSSRYGSTTLGPAGRGTVPPSSYQNSIVNLPGPVDNTNNRVVTGNVTGGKYFRGSVPYSSTTSFGAPLGSTSLDPFLRYSAIPEELGDGPSAGDSFYSSTGTVPRIQPGTRGVFAPGSPRVAGIPIQPRGEQPADVITAPEITSSQTPAGQRIANDGLSPSPGYSSASREGAPQPPSKTREEMRRIISGEPDGPTADRRPLLQGGSVLTPEEYRRQVEQLQYDFDRVRTNASLFEQDFKTAKTAPTYTPPGGSVDAVPPLTSAEALRGIIQPRSSLENSSTSGNLPPSGIVQGERLTDQILQSQTQSSREFGELFRTDGAAPMGQTQDQTTGGLSDLTVLSPQSRPAGAAAGSSVESRLRLYGQPAGIPQLPAGLSAEQKRRIDAVFAPQTTRAMLEAPGPGEGNPEKGGPWPAMQHAGETARSFDPAAAILERSLRDSAASVPPPSVSSIVNAEATDPGAGVSPSPSLSQPVPPAPASIVPPNAAHRSDTQPGSDALPEPLLAERPSPKPVNLDAASQEKFDRCLRSAQASMQQGQYARAAESFGLAAVYHPRDARPQLGRSHALLAAGEYLSSAVCLAKAIELDPRAVLKKADLIESLGGPDAFAQRINELEQRSERGEAPGLQLLLAYVYQQMNRPQEAKNALQAAREAMPSSRSVHMLQAALEGVAPG